VCSAGESIPFVFRKPMSVSQLTSRDNPLLKTIRLISSGSRRAPSHLVLAEGIRVLEQATRSKYEIEAVVFSEHFGSSERGQSLLQAWRSKGVRLFRTGAKLFESVSDVQNPQGALALMRVPETCLSEMAPVSNALILCACEIQDPGNLGTLIRAAAAAGATMTCTTKGTVSARSPKSVRASAGLFFHMPVVEHVETSDLLNHCARNSIRLYRTDTRQGSAHTETDLQSSCAIMLGNEAAGLSDSDLAEIPSIHIPMAKGVESINVAMAGTIILFEAFRQRQKTARHK
jgi:TrmH family RNA methyltransferase